MSRNHYGNLAVQMNQEKIQPRVKEQKHAVKTSVRHSIPMEEKLLYLLSVMVIVCISGFILSRYAFISQMNYKIENIKENTVKTQEENSSLKLKVDELSKRERILDIAGRELGMTMKDSIVRVLSH